MVFVDLMEIMNNYGRNVVDLHFDPAPKNDAFVVIRFVRLEVKDCLAIYPLFEYYLHAALDTVNNVVACYYFDFELTWRFVLLHNNYDFVHEYDCAVHVGVQSIVTAVAAASVAPRSSAASGYAFASYFVFCSATAFEA